MTEKTFLDGINQIIKKNLALYKEYTDRIVHDYNTEIELTKEYNGRQLLELLQNADDAGSTEVLIEWDSKIRLLSISNKGEPFSVAGIKSLTLPHLSPKITKKYIGNKGLGFRSVLNWSDVIKIKSNGCLVEFSENIAKDTFENKLGLSGEEKERIRTERNLSPSVVPFPTLAVPKLETLDNKSMWATTIELTYRERYKDDISTQISELKEEILLFLNNIRKITVQVIDESNRTIQSNKEIGDHFDTVMIGSRCWKVFKRESELPEDFQDGKKNEVEHFSLKVAIQEDLSDDYNKLFNFFPTQVTISLPCIIHGTFELNSSRNHINDSKKNEYILEQLSILIKDCAQYYAGQNLDWRPYRLLTPKSISSDSRLIEKFYSQVTALKETEYIYPCIDGAYHPISEAVYYDDDFSRYFKESFPEELPELVIPLNNDLENIFNDDHYEHSHLVRIIDTLSEKGMALTKRADLIVQLTRILQNNNGEKFSLLLNDSGDIINKDSIAFTPVVKNENKFQIPHAINIDLINSDLYELLIEKLKTKFDKKETNISRELQRTIKHIVNLQPYDSNQVIEKIITGTKEIIDSGVNVEVKKTHIKEMVVALYENFKNIDARQNRVNVAVPLISESGEIVTAGDLFLSRSYPSGEIIYDIYQDTLSDREYLANVNYWGFNDNEYILIEEFFMWLGVNRFSKTNSIPLWKENEYITFVLKSNKIRLDDFTISRVTGSTMVKQISNFNIISQLCLNSIVLLAIKDPLIRAKLEATNESIPWYYSYQRSFVTSYSYIRYQFLSSQIFTEFVIEDNGENINQLINDNLSIDYDFFQSRGIDKHDVRSVLLKLGAKDSFNDVHPERVYSILSKLPEKEECKSGKFTQTIYKMALESLVKQNSKTKIPDSLRLFCNVGDIGQYKPNTDIYYSDNTVLPKKILNELYLLNMPKRVGEDNVEKYFGTKKLKEFGIALNDSSLIIHPVNNDFDHFFEKIKPYLLAYRLQSPNLRRVTGDTETKKREAKKLKSCKIKIVSNCEVTFNEKEKVNINDSEFINIGEDFYYKTSIPLTLETLQKDSDFCDAFAEMMCIVFKVNDLKNDFRLILRNELKDTIHLAKQDIGEDKLEELFSFIGVSRSEVIFWKKTFATQQIVFDEAKDSSEQIIEVVKTELGIEIPEDYSKCDFENFSNSASYNLIKNIVNKLNVYLKDISEQGLYRWHVVQLETVIKDYENAFSKHLWKKLNEDSANQKNYITLLDKYRLEYNDIINQIAFNNRYTLEPDYDSMVITAIKIEFDIDLTIIVGETSVIKNQYVNLLKDFEIEDTDIRTTEIRSLLFFEGNKDQIGEYLKNNFKHRDEGNPGTKPDATPNGVIIDASLNRKNGKLIINSNNGSSGNWTHSSYSDRNKQQRGKNAELLVYNALIKRYGTNNVKWVSGNSNTANKNDQLHYDIEYKNDNNEWKWLEVKSISDNRLIISTPEKDKGLSDPTKYEMALVDGNNIYMIKDVFVFEEGENFDNNSKFMTYPKEYMLSFDIDKLLGETKSDD